jgi:type I restriction enzyme M protein
VGYDSAAKDKIGRFRRGLPPQTKGDYAFVLHMIETLKPKTGRMGVVVPHGVLFRGAAEGKIRKQLIDENLLDAVIGLPEKLFYGTGIPAAIMIFRRNKTDKSVLFIDASYEYKDGKNQNQLSEDNVAKVLATYRARKNVEKYARLATSDEISANDYNLNIPRYVDTFDEEQEIDLAAVLSERRKLKVELAQIEKEMECYLKELGYEPRSPDAKISAYVSSRDLTSASVSRSNSPSRRFFPRRPPF